MKQNGIYDPEGKYKNPLTDREYTPEYFKYVDKWKNLKVYQNRDLILKKLDKSRVLIADSGTGTGKTVIFPKLAMHYGDYQNRILVTIPRTPLVISAVQYAALCLNVPHEEDGTPVDGDTIGYKFRGSEDFQADANEKTKLTFATDGKAITMIKKNPSFDNYDIVIIDEIHERNVNIDIILLLLKNALKLNPNLKLILMSATMPKGIFQNYYKQFGVEEVKIDAVSTYPVKIEYPLKIDKIKPRELADKTFDFYNKIVDKELREKKNILFFMPTNGKMSELAEMMRTKYPNYKIFKINRNTAKTYSEEVDRSLDDIIMDEGKMYDKKIIISTPVWESSKTIKNLEVVFDNGYEWDVSYNVFELTDISKMSLISKGQAEQRRGRVGRNGPGLCYRLFSEKTYYSMLDDPIPPILNTNIISSLFDLCKLIPNPTLSRLKNKVDELIQPPKDGAQKIYLRWLYDLGYFETWSPDSLLTNEGKIVLDMRGTDTFLMRQAFLSSVKYNCTVEMSIMIAIVDTLASREKDLADFFDLPEDDLKKEYFENIFVEKFKHPYGNLFSIYKAVNIFFKHIYKNNSRNLENFVKKNKLNYFLFRQIIDKASDVIIKAPRNIRREKIEDLDKVDDRVLLCLANAYFCNISEKDKKDYSNLYPKYKTKFQVSNLKSRYILYLYLTKNSGRINAVLTSELPVKILKYLDSSKKYFIIKRKTIKV